MNMTNPVSLTIPSTAVVAGFKAYTVYEISVQTPLRSFSVPKRYSEFVDLHNNLTTQIGTSPPATLPPKHYLSRTTNNEALTESRRTQLELYLNTINNTSNAKWRGAPAWRSFLTLSGEVPPISTQHDNSEEAFSNRTTGNLSDPMLWLDRHRELQHVLQEARLAIVARETLAEPSSVRVNATEAKKALVRADALLSMLQTGLDNKETEWGSERLGQGEMRRRRDLLAKAKQGKGDLEKLFSATTSKRELDREIEAKGNLMEPGANQSVSSLTSTFRPSHKGRILGKETSQTKGLDNGEVLQLQKKLIEGQDEDVLALSATVRRQKELAIQINEELEVQTDMLALIDEDVNRVGSKVNVARKRAAEIT